MDDIKVLIDNLWYTAHTAPELNMNNYNSDDVDKLNDAMIEVFKMVDELSIKFDEATNKPQH